MKKNKLKTQKEILIENAEDVLEMLRQAKSYEDIQKKFCVHAKYVSDFIANSEYSTRAREAQKESAETYFVKAEKAILEIDSADTNAKVTRQRELASHYRWAARVKNPSRFGDSTTLRGDNEAPLHPVVNLTLNK
jgi:CRISPR/Cas system-associated endonuclease Cas1